MFGSLNRHLAKIIAKQKDEQDSRDCVERRVQKLRALKQDDGTADLVDIVRNSDVEGLMRHVETHGSSKLTSMTQALSNDVSSPRKAR